MKASRPPLAGRVVSHASAGLIALVLQPVQRRLQQWAERLIYGRRTPGYEVLAEVSALSRDASRSAESLQSLARIIGESLSLPTATVTAAFADGRLINHSWPKPTSWNADIPLHYIPVEYRGICVGFLAIPADSQRMLPADRRRRLSDLARAVGVILHNANLTADLEHRLRATEAQSAEIRASRWRIVAAQDGERRDLERDLHDDAQPGLTAVRQSLGLLAHLARSGDTQAVRGAFEQTCDQVDTALSGLRRTLDRLSPQTLTREGLVPALRERAAELGCAAGFEVGDEVMLRRFAPAIEATVYYCCSEALQNAAKHSPGAPVTVSLNLQPTPSRLCLMIADHGPGFDPSQVRDAGGLKNMADRISAAGGFLQVRAAIGAGTRVSGWVPVTSPGPDATVARQHDRVRAPGQSYPRNYFSGGVERRRPGEEADVVYTTRCGVGLALSSYMRSAPHRGEEMPCRSVCEAGWFASMEGRPMTSNEGVAQSLPAAAAILAERDPVLRRLVTEAGLPQLRAPAESHFGALVRAVVYQQLAGTAAAAIFERLTAALSGDITPQRLLSLPDAALRLAGLSSRKAASLQDLAAKVLDGTVMLDPAQLAVQSDDEVIAQLSSVRGIGTWTAQMLLMSQLMRLDVWPTQDLGVRKGYGLAWGIPMPSPKQLESLGDPYRPYRSVVTWYCWRAAELYGGAANGVLTG